MWLNNYYQLLIDWIFYSIIYSEKSKENQFLCITCLWHENDTSQARGMTLTFPDSSYIFGEALI